MLQVFCKASGAYSNTRGNPGFFKGWGREGGVCLYHTVVKSIRYAPPPEMLKFKDCNQIEKRHSKNTENATEWR